MPDVEEANIKCDSEKGLEKDLKDLWSRHVRCLEIGHNEKAEALRNEYFQKYRNYRNYRIWKKIVSANSKGGKI